MRRFRAYRKSPPEGYVENDYANAPDEPQFEGVVFSDGSVCVRWLTEFRSHSIWNSLGDLEKVHGHPEYESVWEWPDEELEFVPDEPALAVNDAHGEPDIIAKVMAELVHEIRKQFAGRTFW